MSGLQIDTLKFWLSWKPTKLFRFQILPEFKSWIFVINDCETRVWILFVTSQFKTKGIIITELIKLKVYKIKFYNERAPAVSACLYVQRDLWSGDRIKTMMNAYLCYRMCVFQHINFRIKILQTDFTSFLWTVLHILKCLSSDLTPSVW